MGTISRSKFKALSGYGATNEINLVGPVTHRIHSQNLPLAPRLVCSEVTSEEKWPRLYILFVLLSVAGCILNPSTRKGIIILSSLNQSIFISGRAHSSNLYLHALPFLVNHPISVFIPWPSWSCGSCDAIDCCIIMLFWTTDNVPFLFFQMMVMAR